MCSRTMIQAAQTEAARNTAQPPCQQPSWPVRPQIGDKRRDLGLLKGDQNLAKESWHSESYIAAQCTR
jgi:hypothetical protein